MVANFRLPFSGDDPDVWGSVITKGVRSGAAAGEGDIAPEGEANRAPYLDQFGAGMYQSPIVTYRFRANPGQEQDVFANQIMTSLTVGMRIPLTGSTVTTARASQKVVGGVNAAGQPLEWLVFDYPRAINFNCSSDLDEGVILVIGINGYDVYGQLLSSAVALSQGNVYQNTPSAFAVVTDAYVVAIEGELPAGHVVAARASNGFGLPFKLDQIGHLLGYSQSDVQYESYSQTTVSDSSEVGYVLPLPTPALGEPVEGVALIPYQIGAPVDLYPGFRDDGGYPNLLTTDVRGIIYPNVSYQHQVAQQTDDPRGQPIEAGDSWSDSEQYITITYYCAGFDNYYNQILAQREIMKQRFIGLNNSPTIFDGMWEEAFPAPTASGGKGVQPYYQPFTG